ncbi:MAG: ABC transporter substrate-binding protein [Lachnospiraceae bacterium]|nr:ABC transporter substrate-binding protein [Lachnospiraceae bacterium]
MRRKVLSAMMILSLAAACLSGCGKKAAETEAKTTEAEKTTEAAAGDAKTTEAVTEAAGAEVTTEAKTTSSDNVIKVGVFEPLTGENGGGGVQEAQGATYANEQRPTVTIDGTEYTIELDVVDNKSDKTEAVTAAQKLVSDGCVAIIGTYGSGCAIAAGPTFADAKIPAIGCSCTNPQVTSGCEYYFRVCFLDPFQGSVMAQYAFDEGYTKVAVIDQLGDDYSTGLANFFIKKFTELGGEVVTEQQFQTNQSDFKAILTEVKASGAEAIFSPSSITTAPLLIKQARELGVEAPFMAGDTWYNTTIIDNASPAYTEGMVCSTFFDEADTSNEATVNFVKGYKEWLNADSSRIESNGGNDSIVGNTALCFDTYNVICDAIEAAGSTDGEAIKTALQGISSDGVTGTITFDANGDAEKDTAYIDIVKDGAFEFLKTVTVQ